MVANPSGDLLLLDWQDGSRRERSYFPIDRPDRFQRMLGYHLEWENDPRVGLVPRTGRSVGSIGEGSVLWCVVENPVAARCLSAFRPQPSLVLRQGRSCRQTALWWLDRPLPQVNDPSKDWLTVALKRLAYALKGNSARADPEFLLPVQGATVDTLRPVVSAAGMVSNLRDPPGRRLQSVK